ncbi:MAG TPA: glycosyltransferase 87 family protein [Candidatus Nitrosotalea sp.]|nr:glycosyltransferase 87 family protein [Candidatus Nitrosotalea sp.]
MSNSASFIGRAAHRLGRLVILADVVLVFGLIDIGLGAGLLIADGRPLPALAVSIVAVSLLLVAVSRSSERTRGIAICGLAAVVGAGVLTLFLLGHSVHAPYHDSVLLEDAAANWLLGGHDPYTQDYLYSSTRIFYTPDMPINFGVNHFVYPPGLILLDLPLRLASRLGGPDLGVIVLYPLALLALVWAAASFGRTWAERGAAVTALSLNPILLLDVNTQFFNDIFFLAPLVGAIAALRWKRTWLAGILFALSLTIKQQALVALPFLLLGAAVLVGRGGLLRAVLAGLITTTALNLPFLLWNPHGFVSSVVGTFYASGVNNYPIRGVGLDGGLLRAGIIASRWSMFPSLPLQLVFTAPFAAIVLLRLKRHWSWTMAWMGLGGTTFLLFFLGRGLVINYLDLVLIYLSAGVIIPLSRDSGRCRHHPPSGSGVRPDAIPTGGNGV